MSRWRGLLTVAAAGALCAAAAAAEDNDLVLLVRDAPAHGVVVAEVPLPAGLVPAQAAGGAVQWVRPLHDGGKWLAVMKLPGGGDHEVRVGPGPSAGKGDLPATAVAANTWAELRFDKAKGGAMPSAMLFPRTKKAFEGFAWSDRVYDAKRGGFHLRYGKGSIEALGAGPVCTAVRTRGSYARPDGERPASRPEAAYDWVLLKDLPLVFVRARVTQAQPDAWGELHFLELNYRDESFGDWAGGEPLQTGRFAAAKKSFGFDDWGLLRDGRNAVAMLAAGRVLFYDGRGEYGTYLHAHSTAAWQGWSDRERDFSAWLWLGDDSDPVAAVRAGSGALPTGAHVVATTASLRRRIADARKAAAAEPDGPRRRRRLHEIALVEKLQAEGRWAEAAAALTEGGRRPWHSFVAGDLAVAVAAGEGGARLLSLHDVATGAELAAADGPALFAVTLRQGPAGRSVQLTADAGWRSVKVVPNGEGLAIDWTDPAQAELAGLSIKATCLPAGPADRVNWHLEVTGVPEGWGVWRAVFPQLAIGPFARDVRAFVPQCAGVVHRDIWRKAFRFQGTYPGGWTTMQYLAVYDAAGKTGLYVARHDAHARTKDLHAAGDPRRRRVTVSFDEPAADMGRSGTGFSLSGPAVWQILRGDWFDASLVYRDWVRKEASWWPALGKDGRSDTPQWMRELCVWAMLGGGPAGAVKNAHAFVEAMDLPVGFHWYSWHQIPFDNDYPHYFPPKEGFAAAVAKIQTKSKRPAYVMPYINGRLWDTRDKGADDFEFTRLARPAATKDEHGEVRTETYGSKEADGTPVKLAAMCPATKLWRDRVGGIVLRLMNECGCKAVYIDQIAAAQPRLCFDASHGHPLGGGGWWVKAYGEMLTRLRKEMPAGHMLTTECNAEPYVQWFDGYLTWHWQYDGQVAAFPAVYGGAIQMFGRAYRGGPTKDRALRMKAGQQLVFGEQIGWIGADVAREPANAAFLRHVAQLRHRLRRYFHAGRMARPPRLAGDMPTVTADWQWQGVWPVTTDAVLAGAWELPAENKCVLLFVNVSDQPVTAELSFAAASYGLAGEKLSIREVAPGGEGKPEPMAATFTRKITFPPEQARAWEIAPAGSGK